MTLRVQKWGDSLAVKIPSSIAMSVHLAEGTALEISEDGTAITLRVPTVDGNPKLHYSLRELVDAITPENAQPLEDWGTPVGKERFWDEE